ncbi:MAG: hypothetical protein ABJD97_22595, partial [Betaproteobacteria bacterium]
MALQPSTHAPAHPRAHGSSTHAAHGPHAAQHAASKVKPSLSADEQGEGGGFAAQLLKAQPAAARDAKPVDAPKPKAEAKKPADEHASKDDGDAADGKDKEAKTADAKTPAAIDPNALMPWAQQIAPPTTSLADKTAPVAGDGAGDPLGALRKAAGKGNGKEALIASLGAGKDGAKATRAADPLAGAATAMGAPSRGEITAALAKAEDAAKAATDARDRLAALLPPPDPVAVQAGAVGASPSAVQDANQGLTQAPATPPAHAALAMPPQSPAFAPALGHQLDLWMKNGVQHAEVQLSPQDLGPIR